MICAAILIGARQAISQSLDEKPGNLIINEFLASNHTGLMDEDGDYSDWIELYNQSDRTISLAGWSLTDDPDQPEKWTLPDLSLGSHEYLLVFASGKARKPDRPGSELHANFKLSQSGEFLGLYNILDGRFFHIFSSQAEEKFPQQFADISYGRGVAQQRSPAVGSPYGHLATPSPGRPNNVAILWSGLVEPVNFSSERGYYEAPFRLTLTTLTPAATIRYTTDGSEPTETNGLEYGGPINISSTTYVRAAAFKANFRPAPVETHTFVYLDDTLIQPHDPPNFPHTWGGYHGVTAKADYCDRYAELSRPLP
jgi:hypothetical protein